MVAPTKDLWHCGPEDFDGTWKQDWIIQVLVLTHAGKKLTEFHELAKLFHIWLTPETELSPGTLMGLSSQICGMPLSQLNLLLFHAVILTAGILTDEAVRNGTLAKAGEKRKERDEASKSESVRKDEKKAKGGTVVVASSSILQRKMEIFQELSVYFLGHVVNHDSIHMDPSKIEAMKVGKPLRQPYKTESEVMSGVRSRRKQFNVKDNLCNATIISLLDGVIRFCGLYVMRPNQGLGSVLRKGIRPYKRQGSKGHQLLWAEIGDSRLIRPEMVQETTDKVVVIRDRLKAARDHQKSYQINRRKAP
ncbi:hypothetical protein Tco_0496012 [Tanacetum coccineum]